MKNHPIKSLLILGALLAVNTSTYSTEGSASGIELIVVNPAALYDPAPNGYSHTVIVNNASKTAYIAGQGGEDATGALSPEFEAQVRQAYANLRVALDAIGAEPNQVAKLTTYVVDYDESLLEVMTEAVVSMFGEALPAQTLVPVPRLALDGMLFEVDAVAILN